MSELVELITHWEKFQAKSPGGTLEAFCRHYLLSGKKRTAPEKGRLFQGMSPPDSLTTLSKLIRRVADIHGAYAKMALREIEGFDPEWFWFLNTVAHQGEARKTDIINFNFHEQSTGTDILRRIAAQGYVSERNDPNDKRAKLISLTEKGQAINARVCKLMYLPCFLLFDELEEEEKQLIITLLSGIEIRHTEKFPEYRTRDVVELSEELCGKEKIQTLLKPAPKIKKARAPKKKSKRG
jgi:DNA-binding MarR family transcriptional regulator